MVSGGKAEITNKEEIFKSPFECELLQLHRGLHK